MHARAAEVRRVRAGLPDQDPLSSSIRALSDVARVSLEQMRALISELRPDPARHDR
jgi:signal transduction histidine kinase